MGDINIENMSDSYMDVLKEIGNIGAGNATTALATMLNYKIDMRVPDVKLVDFRDITHSICAEEDLMAAILVYVKGDINGMMMFLLEISSAVNIMNGILNKTYGDYTEVSRDDYSALVEIGNIISGAYLSSISNLTGLKVTTSVPNLSIDMAGAILSVPAIEFGKMGDKVMLIQTNFGGELEIAGNFVLIPDEESYGKLFSSLGM